MQRQVEASMRTFRLRRGSRSGTVRGEVLVNLIFYGCTLAGTFIVANAGLDQGVAPVPALMGGIAFSLTTVLVVGSAASWIVFRVTRGPRFRPGESVEITEGSRRGESGIVREVLPSRGTFIVSFGGQGATEKKATFYRHQLRRCRQEAPLP